MLAKFRYIAKISPVAKYSASVLCTNDSVLINFISTLNVIILVRIDWYFHLFVRLYNPFYEQFVT